MRGPLRQCAPRPGKSFAENEEGAAIVEFAIALPLFLLLIAGLIDFGRLGYSVVMAEAATGIATRIAVVRPPACDGVPTSNARGTASTVPLLPFGTGCSAGAGICAAPTTVSCAGDDTNATAHEIWAKVAPLMPQGTTIANLNFSYSYDSNLGFLGGPYVPMVTVSLNNADFQFITPISALAQFYGGAALNQSSIMPYPTISTSLPGEDLAQGTNG